MLTTSPHPHGNANRVRPAGAGQDGPGPAVTGLDGKLAVGPAPHRPALPGTSQPLRGHRSAPFVSRPRGHWAGVTPPCPHCLASSQLPSRPFSGRLPELSCLPDMELLGPERRPLMPSPLVPGVGSSRASRTLKTLRTTVAASHPRAPPPTTHPSPEPPSDPPGCPGCVWGVKTVVFGTTPGCLMASHMELSLVPQTPSPGNVLCPLTAARDPPGGGQSLSSSRPSRSPLVLAAPLFTHLAVPPPPTPALMHPPCHISHRPSPPPVSTHSLTTVLQAGLPAPTPQPGHLCCSRERL